MSDRPIAGRTGPPAPPGLPEPWNRSHQAALDLLFGLESAAWEAARHGGKVREESFAIPPGERDVPVSRLRPARYGVPAELAELSIRCDDLGALRQSLLDRGVAVDGDVVQRRGAFGTGPSLYIRDPDGYRIELKPR